MNWAKYLPIHTHARLVATGLCAAAVFIVSTSAARASNMMFNFNTSSLYNTSTTAPSLSPVRDNSSSITSYMNGLLHSTNSSWNVTVSGAASSGSPTNPGYTGESHVVCTKGGSGSNCIPDTLATQYQTPFILTNGNVTVNGDDAIEMAFTGNIQVSSLSFDFEIFPDASCPNANTCNPEPDFTFLMTTGTSTTVENCTVSAVLPGSAQTTTPPGCSVGSITNYSGGPSASNNTNSQLSASELSAQYLGTMTFNFATAVTNPTLYFVDWPAEVGITNLSMTTTQVPEPGALLLLASSLIALGLILHYRKTASPAPAAAIFGS